MCTKTMRFHCKMFTLIIPFVLMFFTINPENVEAGQKSSDELLLQIMDLHAELADNNLFLAQADLLAAYIEIAQQMDDQKKMEIYEKVINILRKIKESSKDIFTSSLETRSEINTQVVTEGDDSRKSIYEPGASLLEIFIIDPDKKEIPDLPIIRTYWERDLASMERICILPDRASEIGLNSFYYAKFAFYYEAKQSGKYGFTIVKKEEMGSAGGNAFKLSIGGIDVIELTNEPVVQGLCELKKGFHRIEFWFGDRVTDNVFTNRGFEVKVLAPNSFDAVTITKDMMLLKKE